MLPKPLRTGLDCIGVVGRCTDPAGVARLGAKGGRRKNVECRLGCSAQMAVRPCGLGPYIAAVRRFVVLVGLQMACVGGWKVRWWRMHSRSDS